MARPGRCADRLRVRLHGSCTAWGSRLPRYAYRLCAVRLCARSGGQLYPRRLHGAVPMNRTGELPDGARATTPRWWTTRRTTSLARWCRPRGQTTAYTPDDGGSGVPFARADLSFHNAAQRAGHSFDNAAPLARRAAAGFSAVLKLLGGCRPIMVSIPAENEAAGPIPARRTNSSLPVDFEFSWSASCLLPRSRRSESQQVARHGWPLGGFGYRVHRFGQVIG